MMRRLYDHPLQAKRTGPLYNAFSYPTKIDPEVVGVFIAAHTAPGQSVLDVFGGSGTTGIGAALCDRPTPRMRELAANAGLEVEWGPRSAHVYELGPIGSLAGRVIATPPDPAKFSAVAHALLEKAQNEVGEWYEAEDPAGALGRIRYVIWSEELRTPCCDEVLSLYEASVRVRPAMLVPGFVCPSCDQPVKVNDCARVTEQIVDRFTGECVEGRRRVIARIYGTTGKASWSRPPVESDHEVLRRVPDSAQDWVPTDKIGWGDLFRSGYHAGIDRFHHLYTPRNLAVVGRLWSLASAVEGPELRDAIQLWVLSYNASHSTLLTRVVAKRAQQDLVITGAQSGVLYVSGLPVEKNVIDGLGRKAKTFTDAFALTYGSRSSVHVVCGSSTSIHLDDDSIDYVFTDPPFGAYIPYAEVNQVNEAWLGCYTDRADEAIISRAQDKGSEEYARLMGEVFCEVSRVLKPTGSATVVFHASTPDVWEALGNAFRISSLEIAATSVLDKEQVSFKQVVSEGGTRGDALFLLSPVIEDTWESRPLRVGHSQSELEAAIRDLETTADGKAEELSPRRMWSRYVAGCLQDGNDIGLTAPAFYAFLGQLRMRANPTDNEVSC